MSNWSYPAKLHVRVVLFSVPLILLALTTHVVVMCVGLVRIPNAVMNMIIKNEKRMFLAKEKYVG